MKKIKSNHIYAKSTIITICIYIVILIFLLTSNFMLDNIVQLFFDDSISNMIIISNRLEILPGFCFLFDSVSNIIFLIWFYRVYSNLHIRVSNLEFSKGWAIGSWLIPILNLYRPYDIMEELFRRTKRLLVQNGIDYYQNFFEMNMIRYWWILFLVFAICQTIIHIVPVITEEDILMLSVIYTISEIAHIAFLLITIKIIRDYSKMEYLLNENTIDENSFTVIYDFTKKSI